MKKTVLFLFVLISVNTFSQEKANNQKQLLAQYIGHWASADNIQDNLLVNPQI
jgi:hypothetical protein